MRDGLDLGVSGRWILKRIDLSAYRVYNALAKGEGFPKRYIDYRVDALLRTNRLIDIFNGKSKWYIF